MNVYLVRHGQALSNVLGVYNEPDEFLTELGRQQAEDVLDKIGHIDFDLIISSPLNRAKQTVEIINNHNVKVIYDDRLKERDCGSLIGKRVEVVNRIEYWNFNSIRQYGTSEISNYFSREFLIF